MIAMQFLPCGRKPFIIFFPPFLSPLPHLFSLSSCSVSPFSSSL